MRTSRRLIPILIATVSLGLASAFAFDGSRSPSDLSPAVSVDVLPRDAGVTRGNRLQSPDALAVAPSGAMRSLAPGALQSLAPGAIQPVSPVEAFRTGAQALRAGDTKSGLISLEYAAAGGHPIAQWKLGRMYAEGDGVKQDDVRAFEYFRGVADAHADESPGTPRARFVANAFVALGTYYLDGIPNSSVKADPDRAREMFNYAASYFGDPDAQYHLGRMYLDGNGGAKDPRQAARWLQLAATKGQYQAQAVLGAMLFKGETLPRQAARGLMWLTLARDAAGGAQETWITDLHAAAFKQASDDERALALVFLERWLKGRRDCSSGARPQAAPSTARSTHTGTWSDGFSQPRTCLSIPTAASRSAACGESRTWSMRRP